MQKERYVPNVNTEVFVPKEREDKYLADHNMEIKRLANGITIVSAARLVGDLAVSDIHFTFPSGSYNDPHGKNGIHHLFEHLIMNPIGEHTSSAEVYRNASTSSSEIDVNISGTTNPHVREYGTWPLLPTVVEVLKDPLREFSDLEAEIKREIQVIKGEIADTTSTRNYSVSRAIGKYLYAESNPKRTDGLGNSETLGSIKPEDVEQMADNIFIPDQLLAHFITHGNLENREILADEIEELLRDFPRVGKKANPVEVTLFDQMNPNLKPGEKFIEHIENSSGQLTIVMPWIIPADNFSKESLALGRISELLNHRLHIFNRRKGLGYISNSYTVDFSGFKIQTLELTVPSERITPSDFIEKTYPEIRQEVIGKIDQEEIEAINRREKFMQEAIPMSMDNRLSILLNGLKNYEKIVDADKVKSLYLEITTSNLEDLRDKLLNIPPAFIIVGDIPAKS